jgi:hypothetical protein
MDADYRHDYEIVRLAVKRKAREIQEMQSVEQLKQVNLQSIISWILAGLVTVSLTLVSQQMNDMQHALEKITDRLIDHEINHPDKELSERLARLETLYDKSSEN